MDFQLNQEQKLLFDSAVRYATNNSFNIDTHQGADVRLARLQRQVSQIAELGWNALLVPEADGGYGYGTQELVLIAEALGRELIRSPYVDSSVVAAVTLADCAPGAARTALLDRLIAGEVLLLAHGEAGLDGDYDLQVQTRAQRLGDGWRLEGDKQLLVQGELAGQLLVSARMADSGELALFQVDPAASGVSLSGYPLIDGNRACDLRLDGVVLAESARLQGDIGAAIGKGLDFGLLAYSAYCLGSLEYVLDASAEYLKQRIQYGKPLAQFQALQHRMAEMFIACDQVRSMLYATLAALEQDASARSREEAVSALKLVTCKFGYFVTSQGIQLHGGIAVTEECAIGHHYKSMLCYDKRFGSYEFHAGRMG